MLRSTLGAAIGLAVALEVTLPTAKAETIECRASPETREYWSWREIDGRRCWYKGRRRIGKELLSWRSETPAEAKKPIEVTKPTKVTMPAEAVKPAEAIKLDTTTARTPPQLRSGEQFGTPGGLVEVNKHPLTAVSPFETAWRNAMADLKSQDRPKTVRTFTVRSTDAN